MGQRSTTRWSKCLSVLFVFVVAMFSLPSGSPVAKQNLTLELYYNSTWNTVPVYTRDSVRITRGRAEGAEPTPASLAATLQGIQNPKNPLSPLYGLAGQNTPVRVKLDSDVRFYGEVASWDPDHTADYNAATGKGDAWTNITANGILRRLGQGEQPLRTPLTRAMIGETEGDFRAIAHWAMEDEQEASSFASLLPGQPAATFSGDVDPAVYAGFAGSLPLPMLVNGSITAALPAYTQTGIWQLQHTFMIPSTFSGDVDLVTIEMVPGNTVTRAVLSYVHSGPNLRLTTYNAAGAVMDTDDRFTSWSYDTPYLAAWTDNVQGGDHLIRWSIWDATGTQVTGITSVPDGPGAGTTGMPASITARATSATSNWSFGQVALYTDDVLSAPSIGPNAQASQGYAGETAAARLTRLCKEEGIPLTVDGSESNAMGVQPSETLTTLFAEVERTDDGNLYEPRDDYGLIYRTGSAQYNRPVVLTLDWSTNEVAPPLRQVLDDTSSRNDITVKRRNGSSARAVLESGALSVQAPPDGIGRYDTQVDVNTSGDDVLPHHAWWHLHKGTVDDPRYQSITVDLDAKPALAADASAVDIGDVIEIVNLPAEGGFTSARMLVVGYTETIGSHRRLVTYWGPPASMYDVGVYSTDPAGTVARYDSRDTTLLAAVDSDDTTWLAGVERGKRWITTAGQPGQFPVPILAGGLPYSCTAISHVTPTLVAAGTAAHADNSLVTPGMPAGAQAGDLLLVFAAIRNSGTGTPNTPTGYTALATAGNIGLYGKIHTGTESAPGVTFSGGVSGATTSAQMAAVRGVQLAVHSTSAQLNGSAQNIATPALTITRDRCLVLWLVWKQDDATNFSFGFSSVGAASSTLGDDQSMAWFYSVQTTGASRDANSITVTGGASAISRGMLVAIPGDVEQFTVTRLGAGADKSHAAGTRVSVHRPARYALGEG